jgi:antirestriction protein
LTLAEGSFGFCGREHYAAWRETNRIAHMRKLIAAGEQAYSEMYDAYSPAGFYSDAKDCFSTAMSVASELELVVEEKELRARLEDIKAVFRSQFP